MLRYCISSGRGGEALLAALPAARARGAGMIQIREPQLSAREQCELAREVRERLHDAPAIKILLNDRLDLALASGCDGVHLPAAGLPMPRARQILPPGFLVARSCHFAHEALQAAREGCDFCLLGPIFATPSKPGPRPPLGLAELERARAAAIPVLAVGGINETNIDSCLEAGAAGFAAIRYFLS